MVGHSTSRNDWSHHTSSKPNPGGHSRYVIGHDSASGQLRTFKVERIEHAELTAESFDIPPDFDAAGRLRQAWGISDEEAVHVCLRFVDAAAAKRVMETNWHPSQRLETQPDGSLVLTLDVGGLLEIIPWLLSWGAALEVLEPLALRDSIARIARGMLSRNTSVKA